MTRSVEIPEAAVEAALVSYLAYNAAGGEREESMREALEAALPYLAPACQGDGVCTNPRCPTHGIEWDVPAGDGGLREALEKLAAEWARQPSSYLQETARLLQDLLRFHPAAPAVPQPVDREALAKAMLPELMRQGVDRFFRAAELAEYLSDAVLAVLAGEQEQVEK